MFDVVYNASSSFFVRIFRLFLYVVKRRTVGLPSDVGLGAPWLDELDPTIRGPIRRHLLLAEYDGLWDGEEEGHDPGRPHKALGHFERIPVEIIADRDCLECFV